MHLAHPLGMMALRKRKRVKTDPADATATPAASPRLRHEHQQDFVQAG